MVPELGFYDLFFFLHRRRPSTPPASIPHPISMVRIEQQSRASSKKHLLLKSSIIPNMVSEQQLRASSKKHSLLKSSIKFWM
jgi:hypothetical protein